MVRNHFSAFGRVVHRMGGEGPVASMLALVGTAGLILVASNQPIRSGETGRVQLAALTASTALRGDIDAGGPEGAAPAETKSVTLPSAAAASETPAFDIWQPASLAEQEPRVPAAEVSAAGTSLADLPAPVLVAAAAQVEAPALPPAPAPVIKAVHSAPHRPAPAKPQRPGFADTLAGTWVPQGGSCNDLDSSEFLPLLIDKARATAGEGACTFGAKRQVGSRWTVVAECTDGKDVWESNIDLAVDRNRLTWTSERGVASYTKCEPTVVARADRKERVAARAGGAKATRVARKSSPARVVAGTGRAGKPGWAVLKTR
jgi:hypothetical protein